MIKALFKHIYKYYKDTFILAIAGVVIGVLVGIIDAAFGLGLNACTAIRTKYFWYLIWFLPLGGVFIWFIYHQFGKSVANGMKMVFHVGLGKNTKLPIRMVPLAVIEPGQRICSVEVQDEKALPYRSGLLFPITLGVWSIRLLISKTAGRCS